MIKQDYLLRMIQEIITLLINALLNRQKIRKESWVEYDDITRQILGVPSESLVDMSADEMEDEHLVQKSRLKQDGLALLEYVQAKGDTYSIQRMALIAMLKG